MGIVLPLLVSLLAGPEPVPSPSPGERLAGTWQLNAERSDNAQDKMKEALSSSSSSGRGYGGGGRSGHMGMRGGGGRGSRPEGSDPNASNPERAAGRQLMEAFLNPVKSLAVVVSSEEITLTGDDYPPRYLRPDGKKVKAENGTSVERKTSWQGNSLVTEATAGDGRKLRETYDTTPDGNGLIVLARLESPRFSKPVEVRRVYERAPSPATSPGP